MGGSQSQESVATATAVAPSSSTSGLMREPVVHSESSERTSRSSSVPELDIQPLFLPASDRHRVQQPALIRAEQETIREEEEEEEEPGEEMEEVDNTSALMTFHSFLSRSLRASAEGPDSVEGPDPVEGTGNQPETAQQDSDESGHRSRNNGNHRHEHSSSHRNHHRHHHRHHHHQHRNHQDGSTHERRSHRGDRSRRRYVAEDLDSDPFGLGLGISWTTLHQRLQALQGEEDEDGGGARHGNSSQGSGRHQSSRSHRSRTSGPLLFLRPPDRMTSCPYCKKDFLSSEIDSHKSICKTKPRVQYNEDKLLQDSGECSICLDDMLKGDTIARLPCLCIYHLRCLKKWYEKSQTCPAHPEFNYP